MAIGTTAAILGSAVIGAGASAIGSSNNSRAIDRSTQAQQQGNDRAIEAQERARAENLALQRPIYDAGMPAIQARNALLGLGGTAQQPAQQPSQGVPTPQPNALAQFMGGRDMSGFGSMNIPALYRNAGLPYGIGDGFVRTGAVNNNMVTPNTPTMQQNPTANPAQTAQQAAEGAFDIFRNSTGYQFAFDEGLDAVTSAYAGAGTLQSGAAMRGISDYGQNTALRSAFLPYMDLLGQQQMLSAGAANAMSGVNTTYANNTGNLAMANADAISQGAVARANNSNALLGSLANFGGQAFGGLAYRPPPTPGFSATLRS